MTRVRGAAVLCAVLLVTLLTGRPAAAQGGGTVSGVVTDPLGGVVSGASVALSSDGQQRAQATSGADGAYSITDVAPGLYQVVITASGFQAYSSEPLYVGGSGRLFNATLQVGPLQQALVVTASVDAITQAQTGAPVTVIDSATLDALNKPDVLEALRVVPGAQVVQNGARGGATSFFIRGGASNFNKVLVDGIPSNDIGGGFDFAQMATSGVEQVEVLRQTNSVVYGSDALAGVVSVTTRRGRTTVPELTAAFDGGNLGTWSTNVGGGGIYKRFNYYSSYGRFETDNNLPNNQYENGTYAGRFGVTLGPATDISGTIRRTDTQYGSPNAFPLYGVADDSLADNELLYMGVSAQSQVTDRWQAVVRFGSSDQSLSSSNRTPSGTAYDPFGFGASYLGNVVTVEGANGYSATGRAILDFSGSYPTLFESRATRRTLSGQTSYMVHPSLSFSAGGRFEREQAFDALDVDDQEPTITRDNGGVFVEGRGTVMNRTYVSAGLGLEHNAVFGNKVIPRLSVASYLREATPSGLGDTKVVFNAGTGIKAPAVFQQQSSLYELVRGTPAGADVEPIGPERSRSFDVGVEQGFAGSAMRARVAWFHNTFNDLIEYLNRTALPLAGVPVDVANATAFGAYVNSQSYRAQGLEFSFDAAPRADLRFNASYTYLDAEVTEAFSASQSFNPNIPGVAIGAFSPLVGARPFRRPANSGTFLVSYTPGRAQVTLSTYFAGKRDDSTFLSDQDFGNTLLLPNKDLAAAYQKIDLSGAYQVHPRVKGYVSMENLFDQSYEPAFGFPALPFTARAGVRIDVGGR